MKKVFTCNSFDGFYPVGVAAVIVATSAESAKAQLEAALSKCGLDQVVELYKIKELQTELNEVVILNDGNY